MLGVSARTVHNMIRFGTLSLNRCGLISIEDVDKLLPLRHSGTVQLIFERVDSG